MNKPWFSSLVFHVAGSCCCDIRIKGMKRGWIARGLAIGCVAAAGTVHSQLVFLANDFSVSPPGTYNGQTGAALGTGELLGNATGLRNNIQVLSSGGVEDSPCLFQQNDVALRGRNTFDITDPSSAATYFSVHFRYDPILTLIGGFLGMGWALAAAADNVSPYSNGADNRVMVGLRRPSNANEGRVTTFGQFSASADVPSGYLSATTIELAVSNWYLLSFALTFDYDSSAPSNSTWTLANLTLRDWGADGQTGGSILISQTADYTWNPAFGNSLNTNHLAYAYIAGNGDRGVQRLDNVEVRAIPEPSAAGMMIAAGLVAAWLRRSR